MSIFSRRTLLRPIQGGRPETSISVLGSPNSDLPISTPIVHQTRPTQEYLDSQNNQSIYGLPLTLQKPNNKPNTALPLLDVHNSSPVETNIFKPLNTILPSTDKMMKTKSDTKFLPKSKIIKGSVIALAVIVTIYCIKMLTGKSSKSKLV